MSVWPRDGTETAALGFDFMAYLVGNLLFSSIGFVAFIYGKKQGLMKTALLGVLLMLYSYFVYTPVYVYGIGVILTIALFYFKD